MQYTRTSGMEYLISTDKTKIDVEAVHDYLCHRSYWAKGRSIERVKDSIENSICFGLYNSENDMLGFARVVTDKVVFAYLMDLFVFEEYQGNGLGKKLVKHIIEHPDLQVRLWLLATASAHGLYKKLGFSGLDDPSRYMFKRDENYC
jgi:GNAT superfamily N-acetyltransferase